MARLLVAALLIAMCLPAVAVAKETPAFSPPATAVAQSRQGGDHPEDAVLIPALPFTDTGITTGMADDFMWSCPYGNSGYAPDVFYRYEPAVDQTIRIDLCGSLYDTCVYLIDADTWDMLACNDDFYLDTECGIYVSCIEAAPVEAGRHYYIDVDGYPYSHGEYLLNIWSLTTAAESASWSLIKARY